MTRFILSLFGLLTLIHLNTRASLLSVRGMHDLITDREDREEVLCDTLQTFFKNYHRPGYYVRKEFAIDSLRLNDSVKEIRIYPNENFYSQVFSDNLLKQIYNNLKMLLPVDYADYRLRLFSKRNHPLESLVPNFLRTDSLDECRRFSIDATEQGIPWVQYSSKPYVVTKGLQNRHLMVWASHGKYYKNKVDRWEWQRPNLFCSTEDLLTQSIVNPFLFPMLERAGAIVVTPRERDMQTAMVVIDNDSRWKAGCYEEQMRGKQQWVTVAEKKAFAMLKEPLTDGWNPFTLGSARAIETVRGKNDVSTVLWKPNFTKGGSYSVYVSYVTLPNSVSDAHYVVYHQGGTSTFCINQQMGGGTWVYLGTFEFSADRQKLQGVMLTNQSVEDGVVTADAVRFGGGMGQSLREGRASHLPSYLEAARYYTQWAGLPDGLCNTEGSNNDYIDDLRCRSNFLNYLAGSSAYLPTEEGLGVPLELSLAVHTDAGYRPDTIFGTLSISTNYDVTTGATYPSGISRMASSDLAHWVAITLTQDMTNLLGREWTRRQSWDRNYSETRTPQVPSAILELLSHQNFTDMRYAHDPYVKFHIARSIYKSLLRYVNYQHRVTDVVVQPLPVKDMWLKLDSEKNYITLGWRPTSDPLEPTARPTCYIVYTKIGDNAFDKGQIVSSSRFSMPITPGVQYSFRVAALNDGGESFPSEEMTAYRAPNEQARVIIVNGFTRLCGPAFVQNADSVGFLLQKNIGIPWNSTSGIAGNQVCFDPNRAGREGEGALGFCTSEWEGKTIAGNTFDFTSEHGRTLARMKEYSFASASVSAVEKGDVSLFDYDVLDYVLGRQANGAENLYPAKTFTPAFQVRLTDYTRQGGHLLVTGSHLGSDMQEADDRKFLARTLGVAYAGFVPADSCGTLLGLNMQIPVYNTPSAEHYAVGHPDVLVPSGKTGFSAFAYTMGKSAGVAYKGKKHRAITLGVPFECIADPQRRELVMRAMLNYLIQ
ncbi:MAG: hypothetical protein J6S02_00730 [Bacteroidaceae bacterium]|nr:hypothetical protein [Bacteroidaceae bacterium]